MTPTFKTGEKMDPQEEKDTTPIVSSSRRLPKHNYNKAAGNYINYLISEHRKLWEYNRTIDVVVITPIILIGMALQLPVHIAGIVIILTITAKHIILWYIETYQ